MLKKILSISGKPGLFKLVSQGKNMLIVESVQNKKRMPAYSHDKVVSLGDIAIYTTEEEVPLSQVLQKIYEKEGGKALNLTELKEEPALRAFFSEILPTYDQERVYLTDIRKLISWYNILIEAGFTTFVSEETEGEDAAADGEKKEK